MHTLALPYNDLEAVQVAFDAYPGQIACVIVEPVVGNAGTIIPEPGYLAGLRRITREHGALLILDEVMTGFRLSLGGAQQVYGVDPDLTTLGKILGGGLPCGAFGGRAEVMEFLAPLGPVYPGRDVERESAGDGGWNRGRWGIFRSIVARCMRDWRRRRARLRMGWRRLRARRVWR